MNTHNAYCRAAISARFLPPTNTRPSRIVVASQRSRAVFPYNDERSHEGPFNEAVSCYLARIREEDQKEYGRETTGWGTLSSYSVGQLPDGTYVYVSNT